MHIPFLFSYVPADATDELFDPLSVADNLILAGVNSRSAVQLAATNLPAATDAFWVTGMSLTNNYSALVDLGWYRGGTTFEVLYPILCTLAGNSGIVLPKDALNPGVYVPSAPRIRVRANAAVADSAKVFLIGGHLTGWKV